MRYLERLHPLVCFVWFLAVLLGTIFSRNPVILTESLFGALFACFLSGERVSAAFIPAGLVIALSNPLFSRNGATALFFIGDIPYTLEALVYGAVFAEMLMASLLWAGFSKRILPGDKIIYLLGKTLPAAGLTLSCALRFLPLFTKRTGEFYAARGQYSLKGAIRAFSASLSYSAEEAMNASLTMKQRGYGSGKRTFFSPYSLNGTELAVLVLTAVFGVSVTVLSALGAGRFFYYPALSAVPVKAADMALYVIFGCLCLFPAAAVIVENTRRLMAKPVKE